MSSVVSIRRDESLLNAMYCSHGVIEFSIEGEILNVNDNTLNFLNYTKEEIVGQNYSLILDTKETPVQELWSDLRNGKHLNREFKLRPKGNREAWVLASFNPIKQESGKVDKVVSFFLDMTEIKTELKVRTAVMNLTSIVSEADLRGDILSINEKFVNVSKYSEEELLGKPHNTTRHPDMPKEIFKKMWSTIGKGEMFRGVVKNLAKDGTPYYVDAVIAPIMGENGKPRKYLGVRYDITEPEIERQNMRGVLKAIDSSFLYIEFDTNGIVLKTNKKFQDALGCSGESLINKHHRTLCEREFSKNAEYEQFWKDLKNGIDKGGVYKFQSSSDKEIYLQAVYSPVSDETGRVFKIIMIATDVTEQQIITEIQKTALKLQDASEVLMAMASEMSEASNRTKEESELATLTAEEVSTGVQTVAANIEEMVASIKEIGHSANESSLMAKRTMEKTKESTATISKLDVSSKEIGDVIKLISSIAQQTNLLALNATIEAARAGDAGRGFAVVANEVKELAKQTALATNDITNKINTIQKDTENVIEAISDISQSIEKFNSISGIIATAVEEQTATTNEISRVVVQSKKGIESISSAVKKVLTSAKESSINSTNTFDASKELALIADKLTALTKKAKME